MEVNNELKRGETMDFNALVEKVLKDNEQKVRIDELFFFGALIITMIDDQRNKGNKSKDHVIKSLTSLKIETLQEVSIYIEDRITELKGVKK